MSRQKIQGVQSLLYLSIFIALMAVWLVLQSSTGLVILGDESIWLIARYFSIMLLTPAFVLYFGRLCEFHRALTNALSALLIALGAVNFTIFFARGTDPGILPAYHAVVAATLMVCLALSISYILKSNDKSMKKPVFLASVFIVCALLDIAFLCEHE